MVEFKNIPDLGKVEPITPDFLSREAEEGLLNYLKEAESYIRFYNWVREIKGRYIGIYADGIVAVFLFNIIPSIADVDEWIWVIVGDLPSAYITCDQCPNPASALDGYIGAMMEWVEAAETGKSVANLIPVNVPASLDNAERLRRRLKFLDDRILPEYKDDLIA